MLSCRRAITLIELIVVVAIAGVLFTLLVGAVQNTRAAAARAACTNNLRQLGLALHHHHDAQGSFPAGCSLREKGGQYPYAAWCAKLLPYLEQTALWGQFQAAYGRDKNFLTAAHQEPRSKVLQVFACPSDPRSFRPRFSSPNSTFGIGLTSYLGVEGNNYLSADGVMYLDSAIKIADISDGPSNTIVVGERPPSADERFGWWYAGIGQADSGSCDSVLGVREKNVSWRIRQCPDGPYAFVGGRLNNQCDMFHFWSLHASGANFLFGDGSVRLLAYSSDPIMPALATRAGGEVVEVP